MVRSRFAPSPTGDLHLGGALVAVASWWMAKRASADAPGELVVRIEDLDPPRVVEGSAERILDDLAWLGITWDALAWQSKRHDRYEAAIARLAASGLVYPCDCSRAEIALVANAPHEGEEIVYPGTCREKDPARAFKRPPALRLRVPDETVAIVDGVQGELAQNLAREVGDFVLRRGDGVFSYQLAVTVDDVEMQITDVVRGVDLLASTPRQAYLAGLLGGAYPHTWHVPLVVDDRGERLAKRTAGARVRALREAGVAPEEVIGELAHALGLRATSDPCTLHSLREVAAARWPREGFRVPARWAARDAGRHPERSER